LADDQQEEPAQGCSRSSAQAKTRSRSRRGSRGRRNIRGHRCSGTRACAGHCPTRISRQSPRSSDSSDTGRRLTPCRTSVKERGRLRFAK
jgi:hypothetical protein